MQPAHMTVGRRIGVAIVTAALAFASFPHLVAAAADAEDASTARRITTRIAWRACSPEEIEGDAEFRARTQCARVLVPVDYAHPDGRTLSLFVAQRVSTAPDPLGPLFVNQGGPGVEAAQFSVGIAASPAFDRFDVIGMDPRGTGRSTPVECRSDIRQIPDYTSTASGAPTHRYRDAVEKFVEGCEHDPNLRFYGSNNVARDMDRIRTLLGAETISYFGKSYGSDLGTAYLGLFPDHVRAAVLDGATDLTIDPVEFFAQQTRAALRAFDRYLDHCRVDECAWTKGDDPERAWKALIRQIDDAPMRSGPSGRQLTSDDLRSFEGNVLGQDLRDVDEALGALVLHDDPRKVLSEPLDDATARVLQANVAITCLDMPVHAFDDAFDRYRALVAQPLPTGVSTLVACSRWAKPGDPIAVRPVPAGTPVMVVSTRGDVPTPYESGAGLAAALRVPLLTWEANFHTAYFFSPCVQQYAHRLLVDLQPLPMEGATCPDDSASVASLDEPNVDEPTLDEA
jgi:pimeloyl-ACP methyl ester carboxylesterase